MNDQAIYDLTSFLKANVSDASLDELAVSKREEQSDRSLFIIVYGACGVSGWLVGMVTGWFVWG